MGKKNDNRPVIKRGEIMKYSKTRDVKDPVYGTRGSVGIDFFVPNDYSTVELSPGEDALIPSGIRMRLPKDTALIAFNKSGVALVSGFSPAIAQSILSGNMDDFSPEAIMLKTVMKPRYDLA